MIYLNEIPLSHLALMPATALPYMGLELADPTQTILILRVLKIPLHIKMSMCKQ